MPELSDHTDEAAGLHTDWANQADWSVRCLTSNMQSDIRFFPKNRLIRWHSPCQTHQEIWGFPDVLGLQLLLRYLRVLATVIFQPHIQQWFSVPSLKCSYLAQILTVWQDHDHRWKGLEQSEPIVNWLQPVQGPPATEKCGLYQSSCGLFILWESKDWSWSGCLQIGSKDQTRPDF